MIINLLKGKELYRSLEQYNVDFNSCYNNVKFVHDRVYNTAYMEASWWFDPKMVRRLPLSHLHTEQNPTLPIQREPDLCLNLYAPNYLFLLLINELYQNKKHILIEDRGGGMGALIFYLYKLGFNNFNMIENFSQLCPELFLRLMRNHSINCSLNRVDISPIAVNLVGYTQFMTGVYESIELFCIYNQDRLIKELNQRIDCGEKDLKFLCRDKDNIIYAYCKKEKHEEFTQKIEKFKE